MRNVVGELKITWDDFSSCEAHRCQDRTTKEISSDPAQFAHTLRPISHIQLGTCKPEDVAVAQSPSCTCHYWGQLLISPRHGLTFLFAVGALQRHTHKPLVIHIRRLNEFLRWIQRNPRKLVCNRLGMQPVDALELKLQAVNQPSSG